MYQLWIERHEIGYDLLCRADSMRACFEALDALTPAVMPDMTGSYIERRRDNKVMFVDGTCRNL